MYFTTSWDDGHILDNKLSELLNKYNIKGTFFLSKNYLSEQLKNEDIINIAKFHEIGAHTINHPHLATLNFDKQFDEINNSKNWIEDILGKACDGFCYPSGNYNDDSVKAVEKSAFLYARTVEAHSFDIDTNNIFEVPTTLHIYPYPFRKKNKSEYLWQDLLRPIKNNRNLKRYIGQLGLIKFSWSGIAICLFDYAIKNNKNIFHLWGHSWEIDRYDLWDELEIFLKYVSQHKDIKIMTNKEIVLNMQK